MTGKHTSIVREMLQHEYGAGTKGRPEDPTILKDEKKTS